uniref:Uncharacterized protein n=1 Tax=Amphimedon queenslandica TaxID=400682 RepID=A0A1X7TPE2_AMPQE
MGHQYMLENFQIYHFDSELCGSYSETYHSMKLTVYCVSD